MSSYHFTLLFLAALALSTALRLWLDLRHLRHVVAHRDQVPVAEEDLHGTQYCSFAFGKSRERTSRT